MKENKLDFTYLELRRTFDSEKQFSGQINSSWVDYLRTEMHDSNMIDGQIHISRYPQRAHTAKADI